MADGALFVGLPFSLPADPAFFALPSSSEDEDEEEEADEEDDEELSLSLSLLLPLLLLPLPLLLLLLLLSLLFSACLALSSRFSFLGGLFVFSWLSFVSGLSLLLFSAGLEPSRLPSADARTGSSLFLPPS